LAEYEPSRQNIETFTDQLERRRHATGDLEVEYDTIQSDLDQVVSGIIDAANQTHEGVQAGMNEFEVELESLCMTNHKDWRNMQKLILESELRAQERFLKLRTRLAG
jgi:hypothetical protein